MSAAFNIQIEIASLAARIVGPVAAKLAQKEVDAAVDQIRNAFVQLNANRATADDDFEAMAITVLEPLRATLSEAQFARIVDRLRGAMVGFCQRDQVKAPPDAEPWGLQEAGQRETLNLQTQSEPANAEPWWSTSEQAMLLLILLWLCTETGWPLH